MNKKGTAKLYPAVFKLTAYTILEESVFFLHNIMKFGLDFRKIQNRLPNVCIKKASTIISSVLISQLSPQSGNLSEPRKRDRSHQ